ncbi:MAG: polymer-forming cytoskeletal protein [Fidelibacterota bacterium]
MAKDSLKHVGTMIGADAVIHGDLVLKGGAIICGKVYGNVYTEGSVRVARDALVKGDVMASDAFIGGVVEGKLSTIGKVVLRGHSTVKGDIIYRKLVIEEGAHFEGRCDLVPLKKEGQSSAIKREHLDTVNTPSGSDSDTLDVV